MAFKNTFPVTRPKVTISLSAEGSETLGDEEYIENLTPVEVSILCELSQAPRGLRGYTLREKVGDAPSEFRRGLMSLADKGLVTWHRAPTAR